MKEIKMMKEKEKEDEEDEKNGCEGHEEGINDRC